MKKIIHRSEDRGFADHGWLKARHSFSFAHYYDPVKMSFGSLRVLNDDIVDAGKGFDTHPHDNMEIVTIPLDGELSHRDNGGHEKSISKNTIQAMSAGTGILHSEYNNSDSQVNLLQIWVLPEKRNIEPRYEFKTFSPEERKNKFCTIVSPDQDNGSLWINQKSEFHLVDLDKEQKTEYKLRFSNNGIYIFVIEGQIEISKIKLNKRDAVGITEADSLILSALEDSEILIIEVPMNQGV